MKRAIPAVEKVLHALGATALPRPLVVDLVRQELKRIRAAETVPPQEQIIANIRDRLELLERSRLQPIINGTGIIIHTNFGRAPLAAAALDAIAAVGGSYNNLEYDLNSGTRGKRAAYLESLLALVAQAEAATVVNNCAAALVLIVSHFTRKKPEVIISRGELVQIGGGFRIGEILAANGARLREVGATNKTTVQDYAAAVGPETGLLLRVHQSNFFMSGFTGAPANEELATLARARRIPFGVDLGSGALFATESLGIREHEPTPGETIRDGADVVCFSGDKLCGGPQAGIIAGKARFLARLKSDPMFRALRCDKLVLAALEATGELHLRKQTAEIPVTALLALTPEKLRARAEQLRVRLNPFSVRVVESEAEIGGGALPRTKIPSVALELNPSNLSAAELAQRLREGKPPVVGFVASRRFRLDLRTIFPAQDDLLVAALHRCLTNA